MAEREKVAIIAPCPFFIDRGTPLRIKRLASMMSKCFDVHVISFYQGRDEAFPFQVHRTWPLPFSIRRSGANFAKLVYDVLLLFKVIAVVRREKIKLIDGHLHEGAFIGIVARFFTGAKVIYNAHGTFVPELIAAGTIREDSFLVRPLSSIEKWVECKVDRIVAQSVMRREDFISRGHLPEKVAIVEDIPELEQFYISDDDIDRSLEKMLRPNGEKLLIYSGGMETYQGVDFLIDAFRVLSEKRRDVRLVLFGRPLEEYREIISRLALSDRVVFVDNEPFDRLPQYLKICDLAFALRLYGENVPGKLPVYMASGIAVVGTDIKGINTVLEEGRTGSLVTPGDVTELVTSIELLLNDSEKCDELGMNGRNEALSRYRIEDAEQVLSEVYNQLLRVIN